MRPNQPLAKPAWPAKMRRRSKGSCSARGIVPRRYTDRRSVEGGCRAAAGRGAGAHFARGGSKTGTQNLSSTLCSLATDSGGDLR